MMEIFPIPAFTDNYIWLLQKGSQAIVVDPGIAQPVQEFLAAHSLQLAAILVTHWHADHIDGIRDLQKMRPVPVVGPKSAHIPQITHIVSEGDVFQRLDVEFRVMSVPGHTLDHIAYYCAEFNSLFSGDVVFGGSCGRIFEGTPAMMFDSLAKIAALPDATRIYCAHEYTTANLRFAMEVEPENADLQERITECAVRREQDLPTVPFTLADEKRTNPFFRTREMDVITAALNQGATNDSPLQVFTCLREWKNNY